MDKAGEDSSGLDLGKFEKRRPTFFKITACRFIYVSKCHMYSWKIILSLQIKHSWSANLTFEAK